MTFDMRKKLQRTIGCLLPLFLIAAAVLYLGVLLRPTGTDDAINAIHTFHRIPPNTLEVICYGSSRMWRGLDPREMYEAYGVGAYNYGCNWQHITTTKLFIDDSLRTQKPKVALIETYFVNEVKRNVDIDGEIYYTRAIPDSDEKRRYLKLCFGNDPEKYLSYFIPFCAFHDNWVNLTRDSFLRSSDTTNFLATMGFKSREDSMPVELPDAGEFQEDAFGTDAVAVLKQIVELCHANGTEIIFYTSPWSGGYSYGKAMRQFASENDCVYFNLFEYIDELGLDGATDFADSVHLNDSGAKKVADFFGSYIAEHYAVTDMRAVEGNFWETHKR